MWCEIATLSIQSSMFDFALKISLLPCPLHRNSWQILHFVGNLPSSSWVTMVDNWKFLKFSNVTILDSVLKVDSSNYRLYFICVKPKSLFITRLLTNDIYFWFLAVVLFFYKLHFVNHFGWSISTHRRHRSPL